MKRGDSGFTLIELMVVLIIISILASLVTPEIFKRIEKAEISSEKKKLESIFESAAIVAFARRTPVIIKLENNILTVMNNAMKVTSFTEFKFFVFKNLLVRFNANGFSKEKQIQYVCKNSEQIFVF